MRFKKIRRLYFVCLVVVLVTFSFYKTQLPEDSFLSDDTVYFNYKQRFPGMDKNEILPHSANGLLSAANGTSVGSHRPTQMLKLARLVEKNVSRVPTPNVMFNNCGDKFCKNLLTDSDRLSLVKCPLRKSPRKNRAHQEGNCKFMNGSAYGRSPIALVSAPGSGNTWVRGLLEKVTGVCTGSVYCDQALKRAGFTGEGVHGNGVIVVKTHEAPPNSWMNRSSTLQDEADVNFGSAILLVRNPFDSLVSEWSRQRSGSHVAAPRSRTFGNQEKWDTFMNGKGLGFWKISLNLWYLSNDHHPLLVVRYEDLKSDVTSEMKRMLEFLHFPYTDESLKAALADDYTSFKRLHKSDEAEFAPFSDEQKAVVNDAVQTIVDSMVLKKYDTLRLLEYIRP